MSKNTLLVLPGLVKERTGLHTNIDDKLIAPEIKAVQDLYIMPLLGSTLFNKIQDDIATSINPLVAEKLTGAYKILMDDYLIDIICNYTMSELAPTLNAQFWNKGVAAKSADASTPTSGAELKATSDKYRQRGDSYAQRAKRYLQQNAITLFPEYYRHVAGIDIVTPENNVFDSPIWLGGHNVDIKPQPSYNLADRRFDNL
jgi:hypothetical protein